MKKFAVLILICFSVIHQAQAAFISWDAFDAGDEKAIKDQSSGLIWLSLDLTAGVDYVDAGAYFNGWEYATYQDVRNLLDSFFPDITFSGEYGIIYNYEQNCANTSTCYALAKSWQNLFGSVAGIPVNGVDKSYQTRSFGMYADENGVLRTGGSYLNGSGSANLYGSHYSGNFSADEKRYYSTFLTKSVPKFISNFMNVSVVNAPANSLLFILFAVIWVARRVR